jgi:thiol-disulfide isomerase/thioredoxin
LYAQKKWKELEFKDVENKKGQLNELLSIKKYSIIDFWGLWCKPCLQQHEVTKKLVNKLPDKIQVIALNYKDSRQKWIDFVKHDQSTWIHGQVTQETVVEFQVFKFPFNVLLDNKGTVLCEDCTMNEIESIIQSNVDNDGE